MYYQNPQQMYGRMPSRAFAEIRGSNLAPDLNGYAVFMEVPYGTEVFVELSGLPNYEPAQGDENPIGPHGFHINEHGTCEIGDPEDPFQQAGEHWNPDNQPHGHHAGDFPVLFSNNGYARMSFFTHRFRPEDIIGRTVLIHQNPDDYRTQPAGDSGKRIGCGVIQGFEY